jgi:hypothetical protein
MNSSEYKVSDVELAGVHVALMVASLGLLVLGAAQQCHIPRLVAFVDRVLEHSLVAFLGVGSYPWTTVVDVRGQDCFRAMHHEEGCEARGETWCGAQTP